jgi:hypothetical protein
MKVFKQIIKTAIAVVFVLGSAVSVSAQCETWKDSPKKDYAEEQHVLYRQFVKADPPQFDEAFPHWKNVFEIAPAADGERASHYSDGIDIYRHKFNSETDEAKKKEYAAEIYKLYDQLLECYPKEKDAYLAARVYDMFYVLRTPYSKLEEACKISVETSGNNTPYSVFTPYASLAVYNFQKEKMDAETARGIYVKLNEIADYNIENHEDEAYRDLYQQAKDAMNGVFAAIENDIFDCAFFKAKYEPEYREAPEDFELIKKIYNFLGQQGCEDADPLMIELKGKYDRLVTTANAEKLDEFYAANPGKYGIALNKEGKYSEAIAKFKEALADPSTSNDDKASYYFYIASIEFRQMKKYSSARENARKAASLRSGWGQPYMLIGDMYASTSSGCGKGAWDQRMAILAAIDKYAYAKSIDSEVAADASKKLNKYASYKPEKEEGFMRKVKAGDKVKINCWIGETVTVRFK